MSPPAGPDRDAVMDVLRGVYDPCCADRGISIVDMGVVEDVHVDGGRVRVDLVLTTGWCPFVASMSDAIPAAPARPRRRGVASTSRSCGTPCGRPERLSESAARTLSLPLEELLPYRERRLAANGGA